MTRRTFFWIAAAYLGAAALGAIGGITAEEDGKWGDEDEPPNNREGSQS